MKKNIIIGVLTILCVTLSGYSYIVKTQANHTLISEIEVKIKLERCEQEAEKHLRIAQDMAMLAEHRAIESAEKARELEETIRANSQ